MAEEEEKENSKEGVEVPEKEILERAVNPQLFRD